MEDHVTKFINNAISGGEEALGEAWAFRRLIERYRCRNVVKWTIISNYCWRAWSVIIWRALRTR